ncbi:MAG: hypothetical protein GEU88_07590 [Solirubrobacterales bacterium]|nr:hypothetical protein [Solirubrobacterales bacterium]
MPASASAWKYVFQDFIDARGAGVSAGHTSAKKCSGRMLGTYDFVSRVHSEGGETQITQVAHADLRVTRKWHRLKDVNLTIQASDDFDPEIIAELADAYTDFWETLFVRWSPGELHIRHQGIVVFGSQLLEPGQPTEKFKPKRGC